MSEHTSTPSDSCKTAATRRKTPKKPRSKKSGPGTNGQRDAYGRFQAGNPGGVGNPYARQVAMLRRELMQRTRPEEIREIGDKLIVLAKEGNVQAAKVVFSYTLGLPTPAPEPDRVAVDEMTLFNEELALQSSLAAQLKNPGLDVSLRHIRSRRLYNAYLEARMLLGMLTASPEELKRYRAQAPGLSGDQQVLAAAELGDAKNWLPFSQQELLHKPWEPWPAEEAPSQNAAPTNGAAHGAPAKSDTAPGVASGECTPSTNGVSQHRPTNGVTNHATAAPNGSAAKDSAAPGVASGKRAPSTNGVSEHRPTNGVTNHATAAPNGSAAKDGAAPGVASGKRAPSTNGVSEHRPGIGLAHDSTALGDAAAAPPTTGSNGKPPAQSPKKSVAAAARPTTRIMSARTRNILPNELRPRGMMAPRG
jgi:hypothetical protein